MVLGEAPFGQPSFHLVLMVRLTVVLVMTLMMLVTVRMSNHNGVLEVLLRKKLKISYIIIVGVRPLNVLRDILLLRSRHQHHCEYYNHNFHSYY